MYKRFYTAYVYIFWFPINHKLAFKQTIVYGRTACGVSACGHRNTRVAMWELVNWGTLNILSIYKIF